MNRTSVALGVLGLVAVALPASAQKTIKIFDTTYSVVKQAREQVYPLTGVSIHVANDVNKFGCCYYAEGPDPTTDRLWFGARINSAAQADGSEDRGDQEYYLEGPDANGQFLPATAKAKTFFGGQVDRTKGRRPVAIMEINRIDTGKKKDRNVIATTFFDDDSIRMWDLDTMDGYAGSAGANDLPDTHPTDALYERVHGGVGPSVNDAGENAADPGQPSGGYPSFAHLPTPDGHTVLVAAGPTGDSTSTGIAIWDTATADPTKDDAVGLTEVGVVTKDAAKPFPVADADGNNLNCQYFARNGDQGEYWFLLNNPGAGGNDDSERTAITLVKATLKMPADLKKAAANSIGVTVLDQMDLKAAGADILFPAGTAGTTSLTFGRALPNGKRMMYSTDYDGNFYTLTPQ